MPPDAESVGMLGPRLRQANAIAAKRLKRMVATDRFWYDPGIGRDETPPKGRLRKWNGTRDMRNSKLDRSLGQPKRRMGYRAYRYKGNQKERAATLSRLLDEGETQ